MSLELKLLGDFEARVLGRPVNIRSSKARALLAYLAATPEKRHSRETLMALLWSDRSDGQARKSLRQELSVLKKTLGEVTALQVDRETISLDTSQTRIDVWQLAHFAQAPSEAPVNDIGDVAAGEFLSGLTIYDRAFNEWRTVERERVRLLSIKTYTKLVSHYLESESFERASESAQMLLTLDPLNEVGYRGIMRGYAAVGERRLALIQYEQLSDRLGAELATVPEPETEQLYRSLLTAPEALPADWTDAPRDGKQPGLGDMDGLATGTLSRTPDKSRGWIGAVLGSLVVVGGAVAFALWSAWGERENWFVQSMQAVETKLEQSELEKRQITEEAEIVSVRLRLEAESERRALERGLAQLERQLVQKEAELIKLRETQRAQAAEREHEQTRLREQQTEREMEAARQLLALEQERVALEKERLMLETARRNAEEDEQEELARLSDQHRTQSASLDVERQALLRKHEAYVDDRMNTDASRAAKLGRVAARALAKREALESVIARLKLERDELKQRVAELSMMATSQESGRASEISESKQAVVFEAWKRADRTVKQSTAGSTSIVEPASRTVGERTGERGVTSSNGYEAALVEELVLANESEDSGTLASTTPISIGVFQFGWNRSYASYPMFEERAGAQLTDFLRRHTAYDLKFSYYDNPSSDARKSSPYWARTSTVDGILNLDGILSSADRRGVSLAVTAWTPPSGVAAGLSGTAGPLDMRLIDVVNRQVFQSKGGAGKTVELAKSALAQFGGTTGSD